MAKFFTLQTQKMWVTGTTPKKSPRRDAVECCNESLWWADEEMDLHWQKDSPLHIILHNCDVMSGAQIRHKPLCTKISLPLAPTQEGLPWSTWLSTRLKWTLSLASTASQSQAWSGCRPLTWALAPRRDTKTWSCPLGWTGGWSFGPATGPCWPL